MNKKIDEPIHEIEAEFESNLGNKIKENAERYNKLINEMLYRLPPKSINNYFSHLLNDYKQKPTNKNKKTIINSIENLLYLLKEIEFLFTNEMLIGNIALKKTHVLSQEIKTLIRDRQELLINISKTELKRREAEKKLKGRRKPNLEISIKVHSLVKKGFTPYKASQMIADEEAKVSKGKVCSSKKILDNYSNHVKNTKHLKFLESELD